MAQRRRITALGHISGSLLPSRKQADYLDILARQLGYESGKHFVREIGGVDKDGMIKWSRFTVSQAIGWAKARVDKMRAIQRKIEHGRSKGELPPARR